MNPATKKRVDPASYGSHKKYLKALGKMGTQLNRERKNNPQPGRKTKDGGKGNFQAAGCRRDASGNPKQIKRKK